MIKNADQLILYKIKIFGSGDSTFGVHTTRAGTPLFEQDPSARRTRTNNSARFNHKPLWGPKTCRFRYKFHKFKLEAFHSASRVRASKECALGLRLTSPSHYIAPRNGEVRLIRLSLAVMFRLQEAAYYARHKVAYQRAGGILTYSLR